MYDDERAVSITVGYVLNLSVAALLISGLLVAGGGRRNPVLMRMLSESLACPVDPVEAAGLDGDMLEAQAFAHLAVRVARGLPTSCPGTTGVRAGVSGGTISRPDQETTASGGRA